MKHSGSIQYHSLKSNSVGILRTASENETSYHDAKVGGPERQATIPKEARPQGLGFR